MGDKRFGNAPSLEELVELGNRFNPVRPRTLSSYSSWYRTYINFCAHYEIQRPFPLTYNRFVALGLAYCSTGGSAGSLLKVISALGYFEKQTRLRSGRPDVADGAGPAGRPGPDIASRPPCLLAVEAKDAKGVVEYLAREHPTPNRRQEPILLADLIPMWSRTDESSWESLRDRSWQSLAHHGLLRVGEFLGLKWADLAWEESEGVPCVKLTIRHAKTSIYSAAGGHGEQTIYVGQLPAASREWDAYTFLRRYAEASGAILEDGSRNTSFDPLPLYPRSLPAPGADGSFENVPPMRPADTIDITRAGLTTSGRDSVSLARFGNHSYRSGGATDFLMCGAAPVWVQRHGRWRSAAWEIYFRATKRLLEGLSLLSPSGTLADGRTALQRHVGDARTGAATGGAGAGAGAAAVSSDGGPLASLGLPEAALLDDEADDGDAGPDDSDESADTDGEGEAGSSAPTASKSSGVGVVEAVADGAASRPSSNDGKPSPRGASGRSWSGAHDPRALHALADDSRATATEALRPQRSAHKYSVGDTVQVHTYHAVVADLLGHDELGVPLYNFFYPEGKQYEVHREWEIHVSTKRTRR